MPSIITLSPAMLPSKKRRREDGDTDTRDAGSGALAVAPSQNLLSQDFHSTHSHQSSTPHSDIDHAQLVYTSPSWASMNMHRKMAPLPAIKKSRLLDDCDSQPPTPFGHLHQDIHSTMIRSHSQPILGSSRTAITSSLPLTPNILPQMTLLTRPGQPSRTSSAAMLSPCHICHRKPTKKSDLDSFANCMGCDQRTCYICIRQCQNWPTDLTLSLSQEKDESSGTSSSFTMKDADDPGSEEEQQPQRPQAAASGLEHGHASSWHASGHRDVICSRCCVERGSEGEVMCLGCLSKKEGA